MDDYDHANRTAPDGLREWLLGIAAFCTTIATVAGLVYLFG